MARTLCPVMRAICPCAGSRRSGPGLPAQACLQILSRLAGKHRKSPPRHYCDLDGDPIRASGWLFLWRIVSPSTARRLACRGRRVRRLVLRRIVSPSAARRLACRGRRVRRLAAAPAFLCHIPFPCSRRFRKPAVHRQERRTPVFGRDADIYKGEISQNYRAHIQRLRIVIGSDGAARAACGVWRAAERAAGDLGRTRDSAPGGSEREALAGPDDATARAHAAGDRMTLPMLQAIPPAPQHETPSSGAQSLYHRPYQ